VHRFAYRDGKEEREGRSAEGAEKAWREMQARGEGKHSTRIAGEHVWHKKGIWSADAACPFSTTNSTWPSLLCLLSHQYLEHGWSHTSSSAGDLPGG
jgi:hypothetical protein